MLQKQKEQLWYMERALRAPPPEIPTGAIRKAGKWECFTSSYTSEKLQFSTCSPILTTVTHKCVYLGWQPVSGCSWWRGRPHTRPPVCFFSRADFLPSSGEKQGRLISSSRTYLAPFPENQRDTDAHACSLHGPLISLRVKPPCNEGTALTGVCGSKLDCPDSLRIGLEGQGAPTRCFWEDPRPAPQAEEGPFLLRWLEGGLRRAEGEAAKGQSNRGLSSNSIHHALHISSNLILLHFAAGGWAGDDPHVAPGEAMRGRVET